MTKIEILRSKMGEKYAIAVNDRRIHGGNWGPWNIVATWHIRHEELPEGWQDTTDDAISAALDKAERHRDDELVMLLEEFRETRQKLAELQAMRGAV